ncbi:hypothetical protein TIFTF001_010658 [Ficus carica]|uniref:Uncharacterized protein n=1 Tax=Ficus carica TaxID=3494 RepID=A0AA87ZYJ5_FICCA|nr:hypothetical protein TIFTF001_010658 [Ficus carica]
MGFPSCETSGGGTTAAVVAKVVGGSVISMGMESDGRNWEFLDQI